MISGVNNDKVNLMQLFMAAMKNSSGSHKTDSTSGVSKDELSSMTSTQKGGENDFLSCLQNNFSKIDSNGDNQLSKDEMNSYFEKNKPMGPPPGMNIENMNQNAAKADSSDESSSTQGVGEKGKSGHSKAASKTFDKLDTNKDGVVSKEELEAASSNSTNVSQSDGNSSSDIFSSIFSKLNNSGDSSKMIEQFAKKLTDVYKNQSSSNSLLSSALNLSI